MNFEKQPQVPQENPYVHTRDIYRERAGELERGDDSELTNALNGFLGSLDHNSRFGNEENPLTPAHKKRLIKFFQEKSEEMKELLKDL